MSVEKSIDLTATGPTIEEAVAEAVHRASLTLKGLTTFEIERMPAARIRAFRHGADEPTRASRKIRPT